MPISFGWGVTALSSWRVPHGVTAQDGHKEVKVKARSLAGFQGFGEPPVHA
ncbi:hypothetical protein [Streptomyces melanogenes]|uniref:hypothetical protein n=1 Tax=Streptomyces melanogenes TaxID=67326 RepID=UPI00379D2D6C